MMGLCGERWPLLPIIILFPTLFTSVGSAAAATRYWLRLGVLVSIINGSMINILATYRWLLAQHFLTSRRMSSEGRSSVNFFPGNDESAESQETELVVFRFSHERYSEKDTVKTRGKNVHRGFTPPLEKKPSSSFIIFSPLFHIPLIHMTMGIDNQQRTLSPPLIEIYSL